jgi:hypothetical protein
MSDTTQATARPWEAVREHIFAGDRMIAAFHPVFRGASADVNASHAAKCVNLHDDLVAMLERLEWAGSYEDICTGETIRCCPECYEDAEPRDEDDGETEAGVHAPSCPLAALLAKAKGAV